MFSKSKVVITLFLMLSNAVYGSSSRARYSTPAPAAAAKASKEAKAAQAGPTLSSAPAQAAVAAHLRANPIQNPPSQASGGTRALAPHGPRSSMRHRHNSHVNPHHAHALNRRTMAYPQPHAPLIPASGGINPSSGTATAQSQSAGAQTQPPFNLKLHLQQLKKDLAAIRKMDNIPTSSQIKRAAVPVASASSSNTDNKSAQNAQSKSHHAKKKNSVATARDCIICSETTQSDKFIKLSCGHDSYCNQCLNQWLNAGLQQNNIRVLCPDNSCKMPNGQRTVLSQEDLTRIAKDPKERNAIAEIQFKEYLAKEKNLKSCPTPGCRYAFISEEVNHFDNIFKCPNCKKVYCPHCLLAHDIREISCQAMKLKLESEKGLSKEEKETTEWKKQNTRPCPQCKTLIEKNEGCQWMKCTQCKADFCWECLTVTEGPHRVHNCIKISQAEILAPRQRAQQRHQAFQQVQIIDLSQNGISFAELLGTIMYFANQQPER